MPKQWTPEERKAFGDKMRAIRAAKKTETKEEPVLEQEPEQTVTQQPDPITVASQEPPLEVPVEVQSEPSVNDILKRALEAIETLAKLQSVQPQVQEQAGAFLNNGKITGSRIKYALDKGLYPSPIVRLAKEPRLQRFAFDQNYRLEYEVSSSEYTTIDQIRTREPKFTLDLIAKVWDENTGETIVGEYLMKRVIMHEDPETALMIARTNDVDVESFKEIDFLNEMRYLQMRDWLLEQFYPPVSDTTKKKQDMVIDGKLVTYWAISSDKNTGIPFNELENKF